MTGVFTPSRRGRRPLAKGTHEGVYINLAYLMRLVRSPVISFMVKQATPTMRFIGSPPASAFEIVSPTYTAINLYDSIARVPLYPPRTMS